MSRQSKSLHADGAEILTAARTLTSDDHGKTFFLSAAAGFAVKLPPVALGLKFDFVVKTAVTSNGYTITSVDTSGSAANLIKGHVLSADLNAASDGDIDTTAVDVITFAANKAVAGDRLSIVCDGTNWYYEGAVSVFDGVAAA